MCPPPPRSWTASCITPRSSRSRAKATAYAIGAVKRSSKTPPRRLRKKQNRPPRRGAPIVPRRPTRRRFLRDQNRPGAHRHFYPPGGPQLFFWIVEKAKNGPHNGGLQSHGLAYFGAPRGGLVWGAR